MADAITIKALQDASLDAKSLEEVVNGNESKQVTTRKGETYPSVKKAIKTLFENGGLPATPFATKALMTASPLVDGDYAQVTDDTVNNGLYVKTAGAWVKSGYDPLTQAKAYADVYPDVATGLAAVADGEQFQVATPDYIVRYRKDSEDIATEVARLPLIATPQRSTFMEKTKNLFDGEYYPWYVAGSGGTSALLYNTDPSRRTAVAPIVAGLTYTVRIHDAEKSNAFRLATHTEIPSFNTAGIANLTTLVEYNDILKQATFVADVTGFVFVTVSNDGAEPRLQIEEGTEPTEYVGPYVLGDEFIPASVLDSSDVAREALELASKPVSLSRTDFAESTRNLFGGQYYPYHVSGSFPGTGTLYNTNPLARTAIVPVVADVQYSIKVHDPSLRDRFRVAVGATAYPEFNTLGAVSLTQYMVAHDEADQYTFTSPITGFVFVTVSFEGEEPRLQVEEGGTYTDYVSSFTIGNQFLPEPVAAAGIAAQTALTLAQSYSVRTRNLFDGKYRVISVGGATGGVAIAVNTDGMRRSAAVAVEQGTVYTVKIHDPADANAFRLGFNSTIPDLAIGQQVTIHSLLMYNDILKEYTFTAPIDGFVIITVSTASQEPRVQIEKGAIATSYVPSLELDTSIMEESVSKTAAFLEVNAKADKSILRHDCNKLFPCAITVEMDPTDPGPRFIEYFANRMWGFDFLTRDICYSEDEGDTWVIHTNTAGVIPGAVHRLLPTDDGEVLLMTSSGLHKSSGWATGAISWTASKVTPHANAVLFQFAFDGDGKKFILAEYGSTTQNWVDSRFVWISTDSGETFNVAWDSLAQHGEPTNSQTHLHAVCYDRFGDRFYIAEGHGPKGGIYCSTDDGSTWVQAPGMRDGFMASMNVWPQPGDTNGPTVMVATPKGLVLGSDHRNNGMFGVPRKDNPMEERVEYTYNANIPSEPSGVYGFAIRGWLDELSGTAYVAFRSDRTTVPATIYAGTPHEASLVYERPIIVEQDHFGAIAKTREDRLVAYAQFGGTPYTFRADLQYPNTEIQSIVRLELKKLGII